MSRELFSRNADLKRLREEGYFVQIVGGFLVMREVPYVDASRKVRMGTLISSLTMAGDQTRRPDTHVMHFDGDFPCRSDGGPIQQISHQSGDFDLGHGLKAKHTFSSKPEGGYTDYFHKMTTYAAILSGPAAVLKPDATPRTFRTPEAEEDSVFNYTETASDRVGIGALTERLKPEIVAIIGGGGTGSYILDLVAKTPVHEIRVFDDDEFLQHNAFRMPGAASIDELREVPKKVDYLKSVYSRMHRGIVAHASALDASNLHLLDGVTFAFLSMDAGEEKRLVVEKLEAMGASFVDVGMGLELDDGSLGGILRVTASTPEKRDHVHQGRISFAGGGEKDLYSSNIQVADLNALNAALAVIKWKKLRGFYRDLEGEHHCTYTTDGNMLLNGDTK
ncbi:MAG: ThiF family adenylyltransferase [Gammaproteobacteria bacterium]|nr:ThiF family adenylyltransferase [Gammaproteobacteria bacterium]